MYLIPSYIHRRARTREGPVPTLYTPIALGDGFLHDNVRVKIGDVEIDQHFFVQETSSHPVILGEPYITAARIETKALDNGLAYARVKS